MSRNRSYVTAKIGRGYFYTTEITPIMKIVVGGLVSYAVFPTFTLVFGGLLIAFFIWLFIALETPIKVDPEVYTDNLVNRLSKLDINILLENKSATEDLLKKELTNRFDRHLGQSVRDGLERSYYYAHATKNEEIIKLLKPHVIIIFEEEYAQYLFDEKNTINLKQRLTTKLEELNKAEEEEDKEFRLKYELAQNLD